MRHAQIIEFPSDNIDDNVSNLWVYPRRKTRRQVLQQQLHRLYNELDRRSAATTSWPKYATMRTASLCVFIHCSSIEPNRKWIVQQLSRRRASWARSYVRSVGTRPVSISRRNEIENNAKTEPNTNVSECSKQPHRRTGSNLQWWFISASSSFADCEYQRH